MFPEWRGPLNRAVPKKRLHCKIVPEWRGPLNRAVPKKRLHCKIVPVAASYVACGAGVKRGRGRWNLGARGLAP